MSHRLEMLTNSAQRKDGELVDLRRTIESLRKQGAEAGLISAATPISPGLIRRHTFTSAKDAAGTRKSIDLILSLPANVHGLDASLNSNCRQTTTSMRTERRGATKRKAGTAPHPDPDDLKSHLPSDLSTSVPNSPLLQASRTSSRVSRNSSIDQSSGMKSASSFSALDRMDEREERMEEQQGERSSLVAELQQQLRQKEMDLNDFRMEALKSEQQLDQYKESMTR
ncbi:hypothetical protein BV898_03640 [Hypsibius exemplaris]|uniref:Uncharacterized protein n=1 Tax=Hypsibius exemplaris TaxID=2072580 RepID=A0A1W0X4I3_HYPEX|nr:hypothetical protein BV898_03640 [Hypsibius exemplaris]